VLFCAADWLHGGQTKPVDDPGSGSYGDAFADVYDRWYPDVTDVDACVARLVAMAPGGTLLELGVGTGRLALPLAAAGLSVTGVDSSAAMLQRLAAKPGADAVGRHHGDMADLDHLGLDGGDGDGHGFDLVLIAYNTLFNLPDEAAQSRCLAGSARRLARRGRLVVEGFVPGDQLLDPPSDRARADGVAVSRLTLDEVVLTATVHDPAEQLISGQHIQITDEGTRLRPWRVRYRSPGQLDELAAAAGLVLVDRWSDWEADPFDDDSAVAISIYGPAGDEGSTGRALG
jgi:SAM-dependent methyltransferase